MVAATLAEIEFDAVFLVADGGQAACRDRGGDGAPVLPGGLLAGVRRQLAGVEELALGSVGEDHVAAIGPTRGGR
ncbi:hypothetical protein D3C73_1297240 [compost metagenome]